MYDELPQWCESHQQLLSKQIEGNKLPHALLISGCAGAGKAALADWLIATLICQQPTLLSHSNLVACGQCKACLLAKSDSYPDSKRLAPESATLGVDEVRAVSSFLEKKAHLGRYKCVSIIDAEKMTVSAANALLKTLEEPSADTVIVLTTKEPERLLPTIISRCRLIELRPFSGRSLGQAVQLGGDDPFINLSHMTELQSQESFEQFNAFQSCFIGYLNGQNNRIALTKLLLEHDRSLFWLERVISNLMRAQNNWTTALVNDAELTQQLEQLIKGHQPVLKNDTIWQLYQLILTTNKRIKSLIQVNRNLFIEHFMISLDACIRK